ncbi:TrgA family protein [uncultured Sulfitobacter sp.]|uniref:TrgA family protein n=1 Tax=uncultured Sulfitobacter sp. TaxID=191468 RepID=UPI00262887AE|nr:TrgA family protein [uncultured Sulfitobacter sp.]
MPTAARLMAGVCLAALAYVLSSIVVPLMPESTDFGIFFPLNSVLGFGVGWFVMGRRAGRGTTAAINNGLTGVFVLLLWGVMVQATNEMVRRAMINRYDNAFEAMVAIFQLGAEYAYMIAVVPMGIAAVVGAVIAGLATEFADNNWK